MKVFVKSVVLFFGKNEYTNIRRTVFRHKTRIFSLKKVQKNTVLSKMSIKHVFKKAKSRKLSLFTKNTQL